jgi:alkylhydroperoxidase/carboxymuconolactone decarboxylase family protein YurZ
MVTRAPVRFPRKTGKRREIPNEISQGLAVRIVYWRSNQIYDKVRRLISIYAASAQREVINLFC